MERRKSIVLVTVDCLRADHVGFMGYERPTTPFLDSLANESLVVPAAIVAGAPTYYSLPSMLASRYPLALGRDVLGLAPGESNIASALKEAGFETASFSAANPYISSRFGYEQGFDEFHDFLGDEAGSGSLETSNGMGGKGWASRVNRGLQKVRPALGPFGVLYDELYFQYCQRITPAPSLDVLRRFPAADVIVDRACDWLARVSEQPFFLWLHLMDPHSPYYPTEAAFTLLGQSPAPAFRARYLNSFWNRSDLGPRRLIHHRDAVIALYDACIRWVDAQIGRLIDAIRRSNQWDDCVFALTADHGEEFLDHGERYHPPTRLMEELIHVPLLLRVPGSSKREVTKSPFSMIHLAPTLLDAARVPVPDEFQGRSHWPQLEEGSGFEGMAISECVAGCTNPFRPDHRLGTRVLAIRESRFKLVLHFDSPAEYLFDLEADPAERMPLAPGDQKLVRRRLLEAAREHIQGSTDRRDPRARARAQLRDLQLEWARSFPQSAI